MPKKLSNAEKSLKSTREEAILPNLPKHLVLRSNYLRPQLTCLGTTKSWLTTSRRCNNNKQPQHPQLVVLPNSGCAWWSYYTLTTLNNGSPGPPPGYPENLYELSHSFSCDLNPVGSRFSSKHLILKLTLTEVSNPAFVVYALNVMGEGTSQQQWIIHESTTIDPYDAQSRFMKFTNVIMSHGNKYYALSSQGCLVVMEEEENKARLTIKRTCKTRAVPSINAKCYKEYMFESKGEIFLVFLIHRKGGVADEIEVYRVDDGDRLELVKVDRLDGRVLFIDKECCLWYDSRELGCKDSRIYFTGESDGNNGWWMYDMETRFISAASKKRTRICYSDVSVVEYEPVLFGSVN